MRRIIVMTLSLLLTITMSSELAYGQRGGSKTPSKSPVTVVKSPKTKVVSRLPKQNTPLKYNGKSYYVHNNKYYRPSGAKFVLTAPPFGLRVSVLPAVNLVFRFDNRNYYCAEGVIYEESGNDYVVVEPQMGMIVPELPQLGVSEVLIDGVLYSKYDNILYKQIPTTSGIQYQVAGTLEN